MAYKRNKHEEQAAKARLQMFEAKQELEEVKKVRRSRDNRMALIASAIAVVVVIGLQALYFSVGPGYQTPSATNTTALSLPAATLAENKVWSGFIDISGNQLSFELDGKAAPQATSNFIYLATQGFFNRVTCHRLTNEGVFVLQCGDPTSTGTGGPGYSFGPIENAPKLGSVKISGNDTNAGLYPAGTIAMARQSNNASSQGSQFFIVYKDSYFPNDSAGGYSIFGRISNGLNSLDSLINQGIEQGASDGKPVAEFIIKKIEFPSLPTSLKNVK